MTKLIESCAKRGGVCDCGMRPCALDVPWQVLRDERNRYAKDAEDWEANAHQYERERDETQARAEDAYMRGYRAAIAGLPPKPEGERVSS